MSIKPAQPLIDRTFKHRHPSHVSHGSAETIEKPTQRKVALVTGITGQDGSYLTELLLEKGYEVHGLIRRSSTSRTNRIDHLLSKHSSDCGSGRLRIHYGDMGDGQSLAAIFSRAQPQEVYHLAAQSDVRASFDQPLITADTVGTGSLRMLEAAQQYRKQSGTDVRFYQASSSEMFGNARTSPQDESTPFDPCSPYGVAKVFAHQCARHYRRAYGMHVCSGILFNHESPRRGENFVTRKITKAVARITKGMQSRLFLGNLDARRDWGFTGDYVDAMWRMMQMEAPDEYVIATGRAHSVRQLCEIAFSHAGLNYRDYVDVDEQLLRPSEIHLLCGDATKARTTLNWTPNMTFESLICLMVDADLKQVEREATGVTLLEAHKSGTTHATT